MRNYAHGEHWRRFVSTLSLAYEVSVYMCLWDITGAPSNNFTQSADREAAAPIDVERLARSYPPATRLALVENQGADPTLEGRELCY